MVSCGKTVQRWPQVRDHFGQSYKTICSARGEILGDSRNYRER